MKDRIFDFLSILTALVVLTYLGTGVWAITSNTIEWDVFAGAFGGPATMLLGYWVRGERPV